MIRFSVIFVLVLGAIGVAYLIVNTGFGVDGWIYQQARSHDECMLEKMRGQVADMYPHAKAVCGPGDVVGGWWRPAD